jgi:ArsR family transcriptional regulator, arsenate/arsenite/antimonite-responsive transcriptional repressor
MAHELVPMKLLDRAARRFRLLGEPVRLHILNLLQTHGEMNVQDLVDSTGQSQANVSKHLRQLLDEHLVARRQDGPFAFYRIEDPTISAMCMLVCGSIREALESGK